MAVILPSWCMNACNHEHYAYKGDICPWSDTSLELPGPLTWSDHGLHVLISSLIPKAWL